MGTKVTIDADITEVNGTPKYRLYATCTARGSLPDTGLFLMEIADPDVPEDDVLYRVAQVADVEGSTAYGTSRDIAIRSGFSFWRSSQFANYYTDVEVAASAKQVVQDEINALVNDYETYTEQFSAASVEFDFPTATAGAVDTLKAGYATALASYDAALVTQESANEAVTEAETEVTTIETWLDRKTELETDLASRTSEITTAKSLYTAFLGTPPGAASDAAWFITKVTEYIAGYDTYPPLVTDPNRLVLDGLRNTLESNKTAFSAQRSQAKSADVDNVITQAVAAHEAMELNINNYIPYAASDLTTAQATLTSAQAAKVIADADVKAKYTILENSYDAVKAVCPDWTPDTPLPAEPS